MPVCVDLSADGFILNETALTRALSRSRAASGQYVVRVRFSGISSMGSNRNGTMPAHLERSFGFVSSAAVFRCVFKGRV